MIGDNERIWSGTCVFSFFVRHKNVGVLYHHHCIVVACACLLCLSFPLPYYLLLSS